MKLTTILKKSEESRGIEEGAEEGQCHQEEQRGRRVVPFVCGRGKLLANLGYSEKPNNLEIAHSDYVRRVL